MKDVPWTAHDRTHQKFHSCLKEIEFHRLFYSNLRVPGVQSFLKDDDNIRLMVSFDDRGFSTIESKSKLKESKNHNAFLDASLIAINFLLFCPSPTSSYRIITFIFYC